MLITPLRHYFIIFAISILSLLMPPLIIIDAIDAITPADMPYAIDDAIDATPLFRH